MLYKFKQYRYPTSPYSLAKTRKVYDYIQIKDPRDYEYVSRYSKIRLTNSDRGPDVHVSISKMSIKEDSQDVYYTVSKDTENRLDLIASRFYQFPSYWWAIAVANDIQNPFDVPVGTLLRIPVMSSLFGSDGILV